MPKKTVEILLVVVLAGAALLALSLFTDQREGPVNDPAWNAEAGFVFATSTPEIDLMAEGGWWDEMATKKPSALPTMPDIELLEATPTPLSATQTALALTPSSTPTRTPLYETNSSETKVPPTSTPTED